MREVTTLKELLYDADERFGEQPFVREIVHRKLEDKSYHQFRSDCDSLGFWMQQQFPDQKIHAALIGSTSYAYLCAWFGIQAGNHVSVPLDVGNPIDKIADEINRSDSQVVFLEERHASELEQFKQLCPKVKYYIHLFERSENMLYLGDLIAENAGKIPSGMTKPEELAAILFTSGTTGLSKGVMLSNANLIDNTTCYPGEIGGIKMSVLPIHHIFCFTCDILCTLWFGRVVCVNDSMMRIIKNLKLFKPQLLDIVPMIAASLLNRMKQMSETNPDKLAIGKDIFGENFEVIYTGGAYLSPEIIQGFKEFGIDIAQGYGMTECSPRICTGIKNCPKPASVGEIVPGCVVRIADDGEIQVKSKSVMMGYYHNPEETANAFTEDGFLRTGDLGYKDEDGYLFITGRKKNLIILANGENVSPEELENEYSYFAPVKEIVIYAEENQLVAEVFPNPDYLSDDIRSEIQAKIDQINDKYPPAKRVARLVIREKEFPKTASRKIIRAKIHED